MTNPAIRLNALSEEIIGAAIEVHRIADVRLGILLNFHTRVLPEGGIKRRVNRFPE
jgi:hypothetical protein